MEYRMRNACRSGDLKHMKKDIQLYKHIFEKIDKDYPHPLFFCASGGQNAGANTSCANFTGCYGGP